MRIGDVVGYVVLALVLIYLVLGLLGAVKIPWAVVGGFSMEPTFETGTLVVLCPLPRNYTSLIGHVVVYYHYDEYIIHRVVAIYNSSGVPEVETKGDGNMAPDPWLTPINEVYGEACLSIPYLGLITMAFRKPLTLAVSIVFLVFLWFIVEYLNS